MPEKTKNTLKTMTLTKHILIFTLLSSVLLSCKQENKLHTYLANRQLGMAYHSIVILTEKGCPACNSALANTLTSYEYDSTLIVVNALGTVIDLTNIKQNKLNNTIVLDYQEEYREWGGHGSSVILLNKEVEIDSIINIEARQLSEQLAFIKRLTKKNY